MEEFFMINFVIGLFAGTLVGILIMALMQINREH